MERYLSREEVNQLLYDLLSFAESKQEGFSSVLVISAMATTTARLAFRWGADKDYAMQIITNTVECAWKDYSNR